MKMRTTAFLALLVSQSTLGVTSYTCVNSRDKTIDIHIDEATRVPLVELITDTIELRGYATELSLSEDERHLNLRASLQHELTIIDKRGNLSANWPLSRQPNFSCGDGKVLNEKS